MATYRLQVTVSFDYEVEADSIEEAKEQGWNWEDHLFQSQTDEIIVEEIEEYDEDEDEE